MQIGYALPLVKGTKEALEQAEPVAALGYDYVELPLAGFGYAKAVNRPAIKVVVEFYHLGEEGEPLTAISRFGEWSGGSVANGSRALRRSSGLQV